MSSKKIRILHIIKSLGRGGAEMLLPETLNLHNRDQFEFHYIYFLPWKDQMVESIQRHGGKVTCFSANNNVQLLLNIPRVVKYIREQEISLIHAHLPWAGILARAAGKICKVAVIYTEHNKQERYHWITRKLNLLTLNLTSKVIAVSDDVSKSIIKNKPRLKIPVVTVLNGVNTKNFAKQNFSVQRIREQFKIPSSAPLVGTIAVFRFQKRLDLWMELAKGILQRIDTAHFIIVGDGPLKKQLIEKREELNLSARIHMPGIETEVRPYLAAFDVYMMCSIFEGLPIALLEAMSMECPVISTDAGGTGEVIRHGVDGLLCSVKEPEKLVEYADVLIKNENLRRTYGLQARERITENFSLEKMVVTLEAEYLAMSTFENIS